MTERLTEAPDSMRKASTHKKGLEKKKGPSDNWVEKTGPGGKRGQLPAYIQHIALAVRKKRGMGTSQAIAIAIGTVKRWARGGGNVDANTRAAARKAVAEWEALKAKAKAKAEEAIVEWEGTAINLVEAESTFDFDSCVEMLAKRNPRWPTPRVRAEARRLVDHRLNEAFGDPGASGGTANTKVRPEATPKTAKARARDDKRSAQGQQARKEFEEQHPRTAKGRVGGGEWIKKGSGTGQEGPSGRVQHLQNRLAELGYHAGASDGIFGDRTDAAVKQFQTDYGLKANGVIDNATAETLRNPPVKTVAQIQSEKDAEKSSKSGSSGSSSSSKDLDGDPSNNKSDSKDSDGDRESGDDWLRPGDGSKEKDGSQRVSTLQRILTELGNDIGDSGVDGKYGPRTERVVKRIQRENGLDPDGIVGPKTEKLLLRLAREAKRERDAQVPKTKAAKNAQSKKKLKESYQDGPRETAAQIARSRAAAKRLAEAKCSMDHESLKRKKLPKCMKCGADLTKLEEARRGSRPPVPIKRLADGTFAPKGLGQVLKPGDRVAGDGFTGTVRASKSRAKTLTLTRKGEQLEVHRRAPESEPEPKPTPAFYGPTLSSPAGDYKPGDTITYVTFDATQRTGLVIETEEDAKNGRPGFSMMTDQGKGVWGYSDQIINVSPAGRADPGTAPQMPASLRRLYAELEAAEAAGDKLKAEELRDELAKKYG